MEEPTVLRPWMKVDTVLVRLVADRIRLLCDDFDHSRAGHVPERGVIRTCPTATASIDAGASAVEDALGGGIGSTRASAVMFSTLNTPPSRTTRFLRPRVFLDT